MPPRERLAGWVGLPWRQVTTEERTSGEQRALWRRELAARVKEGGGALTPRAPGTPPKPPKGAPPTPPQGAPPDAPPGSSPDTSLPLLPGGIEIAPPFGAPLGRRPGVTPRARRWRRRCTLRGEQELFPTARI